MDIDGKYTVKLLLLKLSSLSYRNKIIPIDKKHDHNKTTIEENYLWY